MSVKLKSIASMQRWVRITTDLHIQDVSRNQPILYSAFQDCIYNSFQHFPKYTIPQFSPNTIFRNLTLYLRLRICDVGFLSKISPVFTSYKLNIPNQLFTNSRPLHQSHHTLRCKGEHTCNKYTHY
jgi:hypothetical protein